jgi:hypothetical protein
LIISKEKLKLPGEIMCSLHILVSSQEDDANTSPASNLSR